MNAINLLPRPIWVDPLTLVFRINVIKWKCTPKCSGHIVPPIDIDQWDAIICQELDDWEARTGAKKKKRLKSSPRKIVKIFGEWS